MFKFIISNLIIIYCTVRLVSYGIFAVKDKNKVGGAALFILAAAVAAAHYLVI